MTYTPPCASSDSPDDWFISRDGKQHPDDDLLTAEGIEELQAKVDALGLEGDAKVDAIDKALDRAEGDARRAALQRRRHAREACYGCYFRTACLDRALDEGQQHGTWGGYYEEQLRELRRGIKKMEKRRAERQEQ